MKRWAQLGLQRSSRSCLDGCLSRVAGLPAARRPRRPASRRQRRYQSEVRKHENERVRETYDDNFAAASPGDKHLSTVLRQSHARPLMTTWRTTNPSRRNALSRNTSPPGRADRPLACRDFVRIRATHGLEHRSRDNAFPSRPNGAECPDTEIWSVRSRADG